MAAVPDPPAPTHQFGQSSVGVHDREEVANKIVPDTLQHHSHKEFLKLFNDKNRLPPDLRPIGSTIDIVSHLNHLSNAVGQQLGGK